MRSDSLDQSTPFNEFDADLKDLKPEVRDKAVAIAKKLMQKEGYDRRRAMDEAIAEAEAWFLDLEG